jgi:PAS domain S-box-containing protein
MAGLVAQLQKANARFAVASDAAGIAIWELDIGSNALDWDDRMHSIYGIERTAHAVAYDQWVDAVHVDDRESASMAVDRALSGGGDFDMEFRIVRPDGEIRHIKGAARVLRDTAGVALWMTGVNIDITDSKRAETQLFKTSSMLRTVLDSATEVSIIATDPNLTIKMFNVGAEHMLGYASGDVVDRSTPEILHEQEDLRQLCETVGTQIGRPVKGWEVFVEPQMLGQVRECTLVARGGRPIKISQVVTAMRTYEGELIGYLSVGRDVTQQLRYEQSLREATTRAEQANRAKSEFLANMSHEIRTPMNAVIGLAYLLRSTKLDAQQATFLTNLEFASTSLLAIINDVLDLSKIEAGELMVENIPFSPRAVVTEVIEVMRVHAAAKRIAFHVEAPAEWPASLDGDPTRLKQILTNLLSNAIRFTDHGGVELRVAMVPSSAIDVELCFVVKDTGIGISPASQARLFAPFAQADASITRRYGGTGLGLSIVKSLIKVLGGELHLDSSPGVGSVFTVRVFCPRSKAESVIAKPPRSDLAAPPNQGLIGLRVLVVDDSDMNLEVVKCILELQGATVALARNGQEALDRLQTNAPQFDAVLMDVQMKGMDGHAATRRIREDLGLVDLPIIALTAGALSSERDRALAAGMDDFLVKPFEPASLVRCIRKHVEVAGAEAGTPIAVATEPVIGAMEWPEIDGINLPDARIRLSNDRGLFLSSLTRLLVEFSDIGAQPISSQPEDLRALAIRLHKLKGNSGMLGANSIYSLAAEAEAACMAGSTERAAEVLGGLVKQLARLRAGAASTINASRGRAESLPAADGSELSADLLAELIQLLRGKNLSAIERFRCLAPQLRHHLVAESYETAREHMEWLRFDEAAAILDSSAKAVSKESGCALNAPASSVA